MIPETESYRPPGRSIIVAFFDNALLLFALIIFGWGLEVVDVFLGRYLDNFGIQPRQVSGLPGIITAHWLHGGFPHLASNTLPFFVLGGCILFGGRVLFWKVTAFVALAGGGLLWLLGGGGNHLGASLVIFGYLGFLLTRGVFERSLGWILLSIITLFLYGGMIFGVIPGQRGISWEGHLFGFLCGIFAAGTLLPKSKPLY